MVGVCKPNGGYRKALLRKLAKKPESKPALSGKESKSSGIKSFRQLEDPQGNMRVVMRRTHHLGVLPSPLLAPRTIVYEIFFGALTTT